MLSVLLAIFKKEGIRGFYRGFGATMINTFSMQYAYFFFYSFVRNSYIKRLVRKLPPGSKLPPLSTAAELLLGAAAGALAQIFTIPVSVIATRQQVGRSPNLSKRTKSAVTSHAGSSEPEEETDDSFLGVAREIIEEEGVTGLWLGIKPGLALTVNPAITYGVYERVKSLLLLANGSNPKLTPWMSFLVGAFSKTLATIVCFWDTSCCYLVFPLMFPPRKVTYPYIMAKVRIQARSADAREDSQDDRDLPVTLGPQRKHRSVGALQILSRVWKREGLLGWYQGMQAQIIKAVLSQALLFMSKDQFEHWALVIIVIFSRLSRSR